MSRESLNKALFLGGALLGYHQIPMNEFTVVVS